MFRVMTKSNPHRPFRPDPDQMRLFPSVSGNTINGLGETENRRPTMVYWAPNPTEIPHGNLQFYFYGRSDAEPEFAKQRLARQAIIDAPLPEVESEKS